MIQSKTFSSVEKFVFYLLILFLPTQLGKHFWPEFSIVSGIRVDYLSPTVYFTDVLIGLLFLFWCFSKAINSNIKNRNSKQYKNTNSKNSKHFKYLNLENLNLLRISDFGFRIFLLLTLFLIFNISFSHNPLNGFYHLLKLLEFSFVAFYVATQINSLEKLKKTFLFLAIGGIFESLLAIAQVINQGSIGGLFYFLGERAFNSSTPGIANASINGELILRPYATFSHPNVLAGYLLCVMILLLVYQQGLSGACPPLSRFARRRAPLFDRPLPVRRPRSFHSLWALDGEPLRPPPASNLIFTLTLFLGTSALILTMSRVAIVLWLVILIVMLFYRFSLASKKKNILVAVSLVLLFLIMSITPFSSRLLSTRLTEEAVVQRQELTNSSFRLFASSPILGIGLGNFLPSLPSVQKSLSPTLYIQPVHNIFLLVLTETGIIGFSFLIWFLIRTYKYLWANLKTHAVFLIALTTILILGLFDHYFLTLQQGQLLFALVIGLCWTSFAHRA